MENRKLLMILVPVVLVLVAMLFFEETVYIALPILVALGLIGVYMLYSRGIPEGKNGRTFSSGAMNPDPTRSWEAYEKEEFERLPEDSCPVDREGDSDVCDVHKDSRT